MTRRLAERLMTSVAAWLWRIAAGPTTRADRAAGVAAIVPVGCEDVLVKMVGAAPLGMTRGRLPAIGAGFRRRDATRNRP